MTKILLISLLSIQLSKNKKNLIPLFRNYFNTSNFMKRLLLILPILFSGLFTVAQTYISAETRLFVNDLKHISPDYKTETFFNEDLISKYPIYKRNSKNYISFVAVVEAGFNSESLNPLGIRFGSRTGNIITLRVPVDKVDVIDKIPFDSNLTAMMLVSAYEAIINTIEESKQNQFEKEFLKHFKKYMKSRFEDIDKKTIDNN